MSDPIHGHRATTYTTLGGTLQRRAGGGWYWADGTHATQVSDWDRDAYYNFRTRGHRYYEVPLSLAHNEPDLAWVVEEVEAGVREVAVSGDHTGPVVLTPQD